MDDVESSVFQLPSLIGSIESLRGGLAHLLVSFASVAGESTTCGWVAAR
jgi:hypothetical protein